MIRLADDNAPAAVMALEIVVYEPPPPESTTKELIEPPPPAVELIVSLLLAGTPVTVMFAPASSVTLPLVLGETAPPPLEPVSVLMSPDPALSAIVNVFPAPVTVMSPVPTILILPVLSGGIAPPVLPVSFCTSAPDVLDEVSCHTAKLFSILARMKVFFKTVFSHKSPTLYSFTSVDFGSTFSMCISGGLSACVPVWASGLILSFDICFSLLDVNVKLLYIFIKSAISSPNGGLRVFLKTAFGTFADRRNALFMLFVGSHIPVRVFTPLK